MWRESRILLSPEEPVSITKHDIFALFISYCRFGVNLLKRLDFSCLDKISIKRNLRSQWIIVTNLCAYESNYRPVVSRCWPQCLFSIPSSDSRHGQNYHLLANLKNDSTHSYEIDNVQCRISKSLSNVMKLKDINTAVIPNYSLIYISALYLETVLKNIYICSVSLCLSK